MFSEEVAAAFKKIQDKIIVNLEKEDGVGEFIVDNWARQGGGGGITRVLENGGVFEKAGVNFSAVHGELSNEVRNVLQTEGKGFFATGVSLVIHPKNPFVPIIHMNIRYFEIDNGAQAWFGGGIDLTPIYINEAEATQFHTDVRSVLDVFDASYYLKFKKWADDYFFLPHRNETRGVGGVFFDRIGIEGKDLANCFSLCSALGNAFPDIYLPLVSLNKNRSFTRENLFWQSLRRSRYAEFNLAYDRGTKFGLESNGRTESILMSLPPMAKWVYNYSPEPGSEEEKTQLLLRKDIDWLNRNV